MMGQPVGSAGGLRQAGDPRREWGTRGKWSDQEGEGGATPTWIVSLRSLGEGGKEEFVAEGAPCHPGDAHGLYGNGEASEMSRFKGEHLSIAFCL